MDFAEQARDPGGAPSERGLARRAGRTPADMGLVRETVRLGQLGIEPPHDVPVVDVQGRATIVRHKSLSSSSRCRANFASARAIMVPTDLVVVPTASAIS